MGKHFPLPAPETRVVFRPKRNPPRIVTSVDVCRMARAAVRHGERPCAVVIKVKHAVQCKIENCGREQVSVENSLKVLSVWMDEFNAIGNEVLSAMGLRGSDDPQSPRPSFDPAKAVVGLIKLKNKLDDIQVQVGRVRGEYAELRSCLQATLRGSTSE